MINEFYVFAGWQQDEIRLLEEVIGEAVKNGRTLREAFDNAAKATGRKANSVRNFYYTFLRGRLSAENKELIKRRSVDFNTFSAEEIRKLIESMLIAQRDGVSVRACALNLADGDKTLMLRYQNKYRSVLASHRVMVQEVIEALNKRGIACYDPYEKRVRSRQSESRDFTQMQNVLTQIVYELEEIIQCDIPRILKHVEQLTQGQGYPAENWQKEAMRQHKRANIYRDALVKLSCNVREFIFTQDYNLLKDLGKYVALSDVTFPDENLIQ